MKKYFKNYICETCKQPFQEYYFKRFCCNYCRIIYKYGDLKGKKINRLLVKELISQNGRRRWKCLCDCGKEVIVSSDSLISEKTKSCGCYRKEQTRLINSLPNGEASFNNLYNSYIKCANERNLSFNILKDKFKELTQQNCFYCNCKPYKVYNRKHKNGLYLYNGLDRVDNTKGYEIDNVVPCCSVCNVMKKAYTQEFFLNHVNKIHDNLSNKS